MTVKKTTPSWGDVKTRLTDFDRAGLLRLLQDLYAVNKVLVLTERTEHLDAIQAALDGKVSSLFVLHGRIARKQRATLISEINALPPDAARVLLATGKLVGEGFDHPPLDTLVLAMPVSWKGTLQQYAGRLHREHASKTDARIIDFVDTGHPALLRMWDKRQRGYRAMGYRMADESIRCLQV
jgi:superfamily II DNA or RNA helicase